jgi:hypothetical protein
MTGAELARSLGYSLIRKWTASGQAEGDAERGGGDGWVVRRRVGG